MHQDPHNTRFKFFFMAMFILAVCCIAFKIYFIFRAFDMAQAYLNK